MVIFWTEKWELKEYLYVVICILNLFEISYDMH